MPAADLHLIFPPQWSPFQPFLSLPSLKAYLEGRGHRVRQDDWNVEFYEYFIGPGRLEGAVGRLEDYVRRLPKAHEDYRNQALLALGVLSDYREVRRKVERLRGRDCLASVEDFYACVTAFKRLLQAFSTAEPVVDIGISSFSAHSAMASMADVRAFCADETANPFIDFYREKIAALETPPRFFGLSVIGQEQLLPALTLGRCLKARFPQTPVVVGGSVFSRLVDRTDIQDLFGEYIDVVCRYEGEGPTDALLSAGDFRRERPPSLAFQDGDEMVLTELAPQLGMPELPTPNFDGLDLGRYFSPDVVLPLLSTRGCYWDKCAFCYHGMIYGDRYRMRAPETLAADVAELDRKYSARHFALNDEAIPPKMFDRLPKVLPADTYYFTGLYKFEKYFEPEHYESMYDIGFRSLYIGLESASERVQRHMRKNNTQAVMLANLQGAHDAGIWNHTFNFFGFPTETAEEAMETADFLIDHADIIHSEGTGSFSFEHNAPIAHRPEAFGVSRVIEKPGRALELYYDYEVTSGLDQQAAADMVERFGQMKARAGVFQYSGWIPREHLLVLLAHFGRDPLLSALRTLEPEAEQARRVGALSWFEVNDPEGETLYYIVDPAVGRIMETNRDAVLVLQFMPPDTTLEQVADIFPGFGRVMAGKSPEPAA